MHMTYPGSGRLKWVNVRYGEEVGQVTTVTTTPTYMTLYMQVACMTVYDISWIHAYYIV